MLKTKQVIDVPDEGIISLLDKQVTFFCANYIYTGKLIGINDESFLLENPAIVYETGAWSEKNWKNYEKLPHELFIMKNAVESLGVTK